MENKKDLDSLKTVKDLKFYAEGQHKLIIELQNKNRILEKMNQELKQKLLVESQVFISNEQIICEIEIKRLKDISVTRGLTLEETKKLDILVKNLNLSKNQDIDIIKISPVPVDELLQIAQKDDN